MVGKTVLVLLHRAVLALELEHLVNENVLISQTEQELAVELELRRHIKRAINQLERILEKFDCQVVFLLQNDAVLGVANVEADRQCQAFKVNVDGNFG